jgi:ribokinase
VLNLSPYQDVPTHLLALCDPLVVNETEAAGIVGHEIDGVDSATAAALELARGIRSVVITLGGDGAVIARGTDVWHEAALAVRVVDTTGAGDAFAGALAAGLANGEDLAAAVRSGIAAGAEAVQYLGAQPPR